MNIIYGEIVKDWGGFKIGDIVRFGQPKGERLIEQGFVKKVKKQQAVNDPKPEAKEEPPKVEPPKVETTDAVLTIEKAVVTPVIESKEIPNPKKDNKPSRDKGGDG